MVERVALYFQDWNPLCMWMKDPMCGNRRLYVKQRSTSCIMKDSAFLGVAPYVQDYIFLLLLNVRIKAPMYGIKAL